MDPAPHARRARLGKCEAGFHDRIIEETTHRQATAQLSPPMAFDQGGHDGLQRYAVQRIAGMGIRHDVTVKVEREETHSRNNFWLYRIGRRAFRCCSS